MEGYTLAPRETRNTALGSMLSKLIETKDFHIFLCISSTVQYCRQEVLYISGAVIDVKLTSSIDILVPAANYIKSKYSM